MPWIREEKGWKGKGRKRARSKGNTDGKRRRGKVHEEMAGKRKEREGKEGFKKRWGKTDGKEREGRGQGEVRGTRREREGEKGYMRRWQEKGRKEKGRRDSIRDERKMEGYKKRGEGHGEEG